MGAESTQEFEIEILVKKKIKASVSCIISPSLEEIKDQWACPFLGKANTGNISRIKCSRFNIYWKFSVI